MVKRRITTLSTVALVTAVAGLALAGCAASTPQSLAPTATASAVSAPSATPAPTTTPAPQSTVSPAAIAAADAQARALLTRVVLPPRAVRVASLPSAVLTTSQAGAVACDPLSTVTARYVVPGATLASTWLFLQHHLTLGLSLGDTGSGTVAGAPVRSVTQVTLTKGVYESDPAVGFSIAKLPSGEVGLRIDAMVTPSGSVCTSSPTSQANR